MKSDDILSNDFITVLSYALSLTQVKDIISLKVCFICVGSIFLGVIGINMKRRT